MPKNLELYRELVPIFMKELDRELVPSFGGTLQALHTVKCTTSNRGEVGIRQGMKKAG